MTDIIFIYVPDDKEIELLNILKILESHNIEEAIEIDTTIFDELDELFKDDEL